jgi:rod shape-determining protein MreB
LIGERTAELIKMTLGSAYPLSEEREMDVKGRDLLEGIPKILRITAKKFGKLCLKLLPRLLMLL